ncbi:MAG: hypothetical protein QOF74_3638 [Caballeronia mineralivorans]|nr:hypothetical protein [Caballeronia mineralivorans]
MEAGIVVKMEAAVACDSKASRLSAFMTGSCG